MTGFVSLVGAGPGDPELLTLRALRRLEAADLVLHDALVSSETLRLAPSARWFYVGKRARRRSIAQETIQKLLVRAARRGERVVRLKCGDPFVFGRGGEEALALLEAGVPFEVVPGVSSAVAAPALSGIPVTHRGLASAFVTVSGHAAEAYTPVLSSLAPGSATVVVLMGLARRAEIASLLLARGWEAQTPVARLLDISKPGADAWTGTLATLGDAPLHSSTPEPAGVLVIGAVCALASVIGPALPSPADAPALRPASRAT
jgi:uroporphyrin-III C-methyltransferase/precorrin-2 dehydrogenase/sirohydrochlorin ferrochelatase